MFTLILKPKAEKGLIKLHSADAKKVTLYLNRFRKNPFDQKYQTKKLKGHPVLKKAYRLRIGNIRVIYEIYQKKKIILVYYIDYRRTTTYSF